MGYLRCVVVGIVTGVGAGVAWVLLRVFLAFAPIVASGSGGIGTVSGGVPEMLLPGMIGFALGFYLMLRRQRARTAPR